MLYSFLCPRQFALLAFQPPGAEGWGDGAEVRERDEGQVWGGSMQDVCACFASYAF